MKEIGSYHVDFVKYFMNDFHEQIKDFSSYVRTKKKYLRMFLWDTIRFYRTSYFAEENVNICDMKRRDGSFSDPFSVVLFDD